MATFQCISLPLLLLFFPSFSAHCAISFNIIPNICSLLLYAVHYSWIVLCIDYFRLYWYYIPAVRSTIHICGIISYVWHSVISIRPFGLFGGVSPRIPPRPVFTLFHWEQFWRIFILYASCAVFNAIFFTLVCCASHKWNMCTGSLSSLLFSGKCS